MIMDGAGVSEAMFGERLDPRDHLIRLHDGAEAVIPPLDHVVATAAPLLARVVHGVWIASCPCGARGVPTPGCLVFMDVLLGWCLRCSNQAVGRGWRPIAAPPEDERWQIEAVLECRPNVEDRNWEPGETIADLLAQNREHGDPVPDLEDTPLGPVQGPTWQERVTPFSRLVREARTRFGRLRRG